MLSPLEDRAIDQDPHAADGGGDDEEHDGQSVVSGAHGIAAEGGEDDRGEPRRRGEGDIEGDAHIRQPDGIGEEILRGSRDDEENEGEDITFGGIANNGEGVDFFLGVEGIDEAASPVAYQENGGTAPQHDAGEAEQGTDPTAEAVAGGNLYQLPGNQRHDDLHRRDQHHGDGAQHVMLADLLPYEGGILEVAAHEPDPCRSQDEKYRGQNADDYRGLGFFHGWRRGWLVHGRFPFDGVKWGDPPPAPRAPGRRGRSRGG